MKNKQRGVLIAGNWKMNHGPREADAFFTALKEELKRTPLDPVALKNSEVRVCLIPPYVSLQTVEAQKNVFSFPLIVAAQNAHEEKQGAFTGEISGPMLQGMGIDWVLLGHSERRHLFGETDQTIRKRVESLSSQGFHIILCVGETRAEREAGRTQEVLQRQLTQSLPQSVPQGQVTLAYEPVWAIGTGLTATPEQAEEAHLFLRELLKTHLSPSAAEKTPILYGGSVTPQNVHALLSCPNVDGALVGGASLKPESFLHLIRVASTLTPL